MLEGECGIQKLEPSTLTDHQASTTYLRSFFLVMLTYAYYIHAERNKHTYIILTLVVN